MEKHEFRRVLEQFPVVRSRNYCAADSEKGSSSRATDEEVTEWQDAWSEMDKKSEPKEIDYDDPFWQKLRSAAEEKVGPTKAEEFCKAVQTVHKQIVYEKISIDAARKFIGAEGNSW
ncbi:uncharacterized protein A4U43_C02F19570 [Asparagus officinalis]|uniref:Uncharacterized protein n=1 Tax=Asparagus officinalis TaxID=4686 RepID=A0A5P1FLB1_ASPOF|nr:uncharacterized protein LOC109831700 [Asparagus officinalis]ONK78513.1 uncharacterized protein A4U43_C02F19570 [Asparagus officinalis]